MLFHCLAYCLVSNPVYHHQIACKLKLPDAYYIMNKLHNCIPSLERPCVAVCSTAAELHVYLIVQASFVQ
jgi:hypothetical protein